jgi:hypothetical protein
METGLATLMEKHGRMTSQCYKLPPLAQALSKERITVLENEIAAIRSRLEPLQQQIEACWADLHTLKEKIDAARVTIEKGTLRQIAEALRSVIDKIECAFVPKGNAHSKLESVTIIPVVGASMAIKANDVKLLPVGSDSRGPVPPEHRFCRRSPRPWA